MSFAKIWLLVFGAALVATVVCSKKDHGIRARTKEERVRRFFRGGAPAVPPFFAGNQRPIGLPDITRGKEIQQTLTGSPTVYFVSLFDPVENTPFYSAYKVTPTDAAKFGAHKRDELGMNPPWSDPSDVDGLDEAYGKAMIQLKPKMNRGHMNPVVINTFNLNFMKATLTLTNAVPQSVIANGDAWAKYENKIKQYAQTCSNQGRGGTLYLLTGKSKYDLYEYKYKNTPIARNLYVWKFPFKNKKNNAMLELVAPRAVWTAGCCVWEESSLLGLRRTKRAVSFAVMSNNYMEKGEKQPLQMVMSVSELEKGLAELGPVNLFPGEENCRNTLNDVKGNPNF